MNDQIIKEENWIPLHLQAQLDALDFVSQCDVMEKVMEKVADLDLRYPIGMDVLKSTLALPNGSLIVELLASYTISSARRCLQREGSNDS